MLEGFPDVGLSAVLVVIKDFVMIAARPWREPEDGVGQVGWARADFFVAVLALSEADANDSGKALNSLQARFMSGQRVNHFPLKIHGRISCRSLTGQAVATYGMG